LEASFLDVKLVDTPEQAKQLAKEYLGNHLVTK
jgi:hypothetical protein